MKRKAFTNKQYRLYVLTILLEACYLALSQNGHTRKSQKKLIAEVRSAIDRENRLSGEE